MAALGVEWTGCTSTESLWGKSQRGRGGESKAALAVPCAYGGNPRRTLGEEVLSGLGSLSGVGYVSSLDIGRIRLAETVLNALSSLHITDPNRCQQ